ncbi:MAG: hypothetical protein WAM14_06570, partial [Candidatus Nitrosopolaris sp.]
NKYWKKNKADLVAEPFNLEECFTLLELQLNEAEKNNSLETLQELNTILYILTSLIREVLSDFQEYGFNHSILMQQFGRILYKEKPNILTFNYDFFIERALENASGVNESTDRRTENDEVGHSYWNWNRPLAYGLKFDEVMLHDGAKGNARKCIEGEKFYSHDRNKLYSDLCILKLHGSLNWFQYLPLSPIQNMPEEKTRAAYEQRKQRVILTEVAHPVGAGYYPPNKDQLYLHPLIITPIIHKDIYLEDKEVHGRVFSPLWTKAKDCLSKCNKLVIIGYSFPATDFLTKKLFLESFVDNKLDELIIVNPDDSVIHKVTDLCHFQDPTRYKDVSEFIRRIMPADETFQDK